MFGYVTRLLFIYGGSPSSNVRFTKSCLRLENVCNWEIFSVFIINFVYINLIINILLRYARVLHVYQTSVYMFGKDFWDNATI